VPTASARFVYVRNTQVNFSWPNTSLPIGSYVAEGTTSTDARGLGASLNNAFTVTVPVVFPQ
jgi:hypothetical protein